MNPQPRELIMENNSGNTRGELRREPWNKGKIVGQKAPLKLKDIWAAGATADGEPDSGAGAAQSGH
jgi:hypothetical protein